LSTREPARACPFDLSRTISSPTSSILSARSAPLARCGKSFWTGLSPWLPGIERRQAGPEFARCRRSSRTPERRESRGRIGKGRSRQASQARPRRLSATVANSWSQWVPSHRADVAWRWQRHLLGNSGRRKT
jgi:hypothetical protein